LFKVTNQAQEALGSEADNAAVLMRVYGKDTDQLVNREVEAHVHAQLAQLGLAAPLLARFENGLLYRYIPGHVCEASDLGRPNVWQAVAATLGEWHAKLSMEHINVPRSPPANGFLRDTTSSSIKEQITSWKSAPNVWSEMQQWISILPTNTETQITRRKTLQVELERSFMELELTGENLGSTVGRSCSFLAG
jgi:ethanolamine kinase